MYNMTSCPRGHEMTFTVVGTRENASRSSSQMSRHWTPTGRQKPRRPKTTWRRTVIAELQGMGLTWCDAQHVAHDRIKWRMVVAALRPSRDEDDSTICQTIRIVLILCFVSLHASTMHHPA